MCLGSETRGGAVSLENTATVGTKRESTCGCLRGAGVPNTQITIEGNE